MQPSITLVPYSPDRKSEIVDLLNLSLGHKPSLNRDAAYWTWKHEENPFGRSILLLAESDGRIVGLRAFLRWRLRINGKTIPVAKPVDSVTHPDFQRQGVFSRLTMAACEKAEQEGIAFLFNTPNKNSLPGYLKLGWKSVGKLPLSVKLLRPFSALKHFVQSRAQRDDVPESSAFFASSPTPAEAFFQDETRVQNLMDSATAESVRLQTDRSLPFLRWRYTRHPHYHYFVELSESAGRIDGALFYRTNVRRGMREILIDDALVDGDAESTFNTLLENLKSRVCADYIVLHAPVDLTMQRPVRSFGFRRVAGRGIHLVARSLTNGCTVDPFSVQHWSLCLGDLEGL